MQTTIPIPAGTKNPPGTQAYEWAGELPEFSTNDSPKTRLTKRKS